MRRSTRRRRGEPETVTIPAEHRPAMSDPRTFRKLPVPVEAVQWDGTEQGAEDIIVWILSGGGRARFRPHRDERRAGNGELSQMLDPAHIDITTLEGPRQRVDPQAWVIRGVKGEFYPCRGDIFAETYEPVPEPASSGLVIWDPATIKTTTLCAPPATPVAVDRQMLVGFSGYLRSGKDTAGSALTELGWHHGSFAAKLKEFLYALDPIIKHRVSPNVTYRLAALVDAYGWERAKDDFPEVRALLQRCGTNAGRRVLWDSVWVDAAMRDLPDGVPAVFTDCRFTNEADAIRDRGGIVIRVDRPGYEPGPDAHESETALDGYDFDVRILNDGTIEDLQQKVYAAVGARMRS